MGFGQRTLWGKMGQYVSACGPAGMPGWLKLGAYVEELGQHLLDMRLRDVRRSRMAVAKSVS